MSYVGIGNRQDYIADFPTQSFNGDGSTTTFTLNFEAVTGSVRVAVDNVLQPADGTAYYTNGNSITFTSAPSTGTANITVTYLGTVRNVSSVSDGAITTNKIADGAVTAAKLFYDYNAYRNLIINGDMSIAQRGTSSTSTGYVVDRFNFRVSNTDQFAYTHSQSTTVPTGQGFASSWKLDVTTAETTLDSDEEVAFQTRLEAQNLQSLKFGTSSAETLSLSFWVRSNKTGTYGIYLRQHDAGKNYVASYTISSADTWEKKTISISGNTADTIANDNGIGFWINWTLSAGSSLVGATTDSWHTATTTIAPTGQVDITDSTSNEWYITGVQLEVGTSASDFEFLPYDVNLRRCERYYQFGVGGWYGLTSGGGYGGVINFRDKMRTSPSIDSNGCSILDYNNRFNSTAVTTATYISDDGAIIQKAQSASSDSGYYMAKLAFDAEL